MQALDVVFAGRDEFLAQEEHVARGCLFLPVPVPAPEPLTDVVVRLRTPTGMTAEFRARILQVFGRSGMVVGFDDAASAKQLFAQWFDETSLVETATGPTTAGWGPATVTQWTARSTAAPPVSAPPEPEEKADEEPAPPSEVAVDEKQAGPLIDQIRAMNTQQRMQLAAHGDRTARLILMKDTNKTIQTFVLQNPHITLDEVRYLAGFRQATPDVLQMVAAHREWSQNAGVVAALVRNPKTPLSTAVRLLDKLAATELRRIAKSNDVPRGVQLAARKKVHDSP